MTAKLEHVTPTVAQEAHGSRKAQEVVESLRSGALTPHHAWLAYVQIASLYGRASPACASFVRELAKQAK